MVWKILQRNVRYVLYTGAFTAYGMSVIHCVTNYMVSIAVCGGKSMEPVVHPGDVWVTECVSRIRGTVHKGDIVTVIKPIEPDHILCKRVVAMAGEKVTKDNGDTIQIPKGHIWIEGDNKSVSIDSRDFGPVPYALIQSRLWFRKHLPTPNNRQNLLDASEKYNSSQSLIYDVRSVTAFDLVV